MLRSAKYVSAALDYIYKIKPILFRAVKYEFKLGIFNFVAKKFYWIETNLCTKSYIISKVV